jgi:hypothetical protein
VLGRLEPEEAPALRVPERLPARVERFRRVELVLGADVAEVPAEPAVAQARADVGMPRDEPALEPFLVVERRRLAKGGEPRVRVGKEGQIGGIEPRAQVWATIVMPPRAFCSRVTVTRSAPRPRADATSSRIRTASASQNAPSLRKLAR